MQHPYRHSPNQVYRSVPYDAPKVPSPASPSAPAPNGHALLTPGPSNRPGSGLNMSHMLHPSPHQVPPAPLTMPFGRSYDSASGSPGMTSSVSSEAQLRGGMMSGNSSPLPMQMISASQQHQKRAYRQRRKDPSCDACRERKVKCDASESSSCTECSNRNVRCQFTKETNRRMSSIKQVQDLEKQLSQANQEIVRLRSILTTITGSTDIDLETINQRIVVLPDVGRHPPRRNRSPVRQDLQEVRSNMRKYGRGIMKMPPPFRQPPPPPLITENPPPLPPRETADHLIAQYHSSLHPVLPILHWPTFLVEYEAIYRSGSFLGAPREWTAVFFGVLACGTAHSRDTSMFLRGKEYSDLCNFTIDVWQDDFSMDQARAALLTSMYYYEANNKSGSWVWLGSAVRIAQDIGLHVDSEPLPALEGEMRKRVWWGIYTWDRLLAIELGRPVLINDQDCTVGLPCPVDEKYIANHIQLQESQDTTALLAAIHVVRSLSQLSKILACPVIMAPALDTFEHHFDTLLTTFPSQYHAMSNQHLDPRSLAPIIYLQNARLILHRHRLNPSYGFEERHAALASCTKVAQETARLLARCQSSDTALSDPNWRAVVASSASALLCAHIWRCTLMLLFQGEYEAALTCVQTCGVIGGARAINTACGRYIVFFIKFLVDRMRRGVPLDSDLDEEAVAYASGDLQGWTNGNWIWQGSESSSQQGMFSLSSAVSDSVVMSSAADQSNKPSTDEEEAAWEGWSWVENSVRHLAREQQQQRQAASFLSPTSTPSSASRSHPNSESSSRMNIANIIGDMSG